MLLDIRQFPYRRIQFAYKGARQTDFKCLKIKY